MNINNLTVTGSTGLFLHNTFTTLSNEFIGHNGPPGPIDDPQTSLPSISVLESDKLNKGLGAEPHIGTNTNPNPNLNDISQSITDENHFLSKDDELYDHELLTSKLEKMFFDIFLKDSIKLNKEDTDDKSHNNSSEELPIEQKSNSEDNLTEQIIEQITEQITEQDDNLIKFINKFNSKINKKNKKQYNKKTSEKSKDINLD
jgi:hypothetical protein